MSEIRCIDEIIKRALLFGVGFSCPLLDFFSQTIELDQLKLSLLTYNKLKLTFKNVCILVLGLHFSRLVSKLSR